MIAPTNCPDFDLSTTPISSFFAKTTFFISSMLIPAGMYFCKYTSSASSVLAKSMRPPFVNCSIDSFLCLADLLTTVMASSSGSISCGFLFWETSSFTNAAKSPLKTESLISFLASMASFISFFICSWIVIPLMLTQKCALNTPLSLNKKAV